MRDAAERLQARCNYTMLDGNENPTKEWDIEA
jgi:hypothetical protein